MPEEQELRSIRLKLRAYDLLEAKILLLLSKEDQTHESLFAVLCDPKDQNPQLLVYRALGSLVNKGLIEPTRGLNPNHTIALVKELYDLLVV